MFRFTIRDVLWLMVVVGLACGWWVEHRAMQAIRAWWPEHVAREHSSNPNGYKRLLMREGPPFPY
jgi:hypothetical protein